MNSPPDPGSPTDSTSTSGTPPPEEVVSGNVQAESRSSGLGLFQLANQITATLSGSSKRRNPSGGPNANASAARDPKLRRRGEGSRSTWEARGETQGSRKDKDELVDANIVEYLRKEVGDPFLEVSTSTSSL
ncbi:hypothetical protein P691DRAFT_670578 [Macrolepiota fuliginosa MF-IS2]|uniref:Uncharacterized protein n=1 Tax=Macrolepiota fuliginosa MF-IS2 TaxID=1400762 RepID=A0A9P5XBW6_9AGAR|nr:hypothetical protein P691DRAFT_670578 [Macrolepiota fuliginosa MF-IS2]